MRTPKLLFQAFILSLGISFLFISACERGENKLPRSGHSLNPIENPSNMTALRDVISFIEDNAVLPKKADKLNAYYRYYAIDTQNSDYDIVAIYYDRTFNHLMTGTIEIPNMHQAYLVRFDNLPIILDGGCSVITIRFNSKTMKFLKTMDP